MKMWRAQEDAGCLLHISTFLFPFTNEYLFNLFQTESVTNPEAHCLSSISWPTNSFVCLRLPLHAGVTGPCDHAQLLCKCQNFDSCLLAVTTVLLPTEPSWLQTLFFTSAHRPMAFYTALCFAHAALQISSILIFLLLEGLTLLLYQDLYIDGDLCRKPSAESFKVCLPISSFQLKCIQLRDRLAKH